MADEQDIISRPPSHPIATSLLVIGMLSMGGAIYFVWDELFTQYLPTPGAGAAAASGPSSQDIAENHKRKHFENDSAFKHSEDPNALMGHIETELGIKGNGANNEPNDG